jgi:hypothetical protein
MLRRILVIACLFLVTGAGQAQQAEQLREIQRAQVGAGITRQNIDSVIERELARQRVLQQLGTRDGLYEPPANPLDAYLNRDRPPIVPKAAQSRLPRRDGSLEQGIPESQVNQMLIAMKLRPAPPLDPRLLTPIAGEQDCNNAQIALGSALGETANDTYVKEWLKTISEFGSVRMDRVDDIVGRDGKQLLPLIREYNRTCLTDVARLTPGALADNLALAVGVLRYNADQSIGGWGTICTATRITATLVLTAKHCFYDMERETAIRAETLARVAAAAYRFFLPALNRELLVTGIACAADNAQDAACLRYGPAGRRQAGFGADFVLLTVAANDLPIPAVTVGSRGVKPGDAVLLLGFNSFAAIEEIAKKQLVDPQGYMPMPAPLRFSRAGTCTVAVVQDVCIVHTCQSSEGTSGAALLQTTDDGALRVIGLHVAPSDTQELYMGGEQCMVKPFAVDRLYTAGVQRYTANIGLQLAP